MNINKISTKIYKTNTIFTNSKKLNVPLKDGTQAVIKFTDNAYECLIINKDNKIIGGKGYSSPKTIQDEQENLFEKVMKITKDSFDFVEEFTRAIL